MVKVNFLYFLIYFSSYNLVSSGFKSITGSFSSVSTKLFLDDTINEVDPVGSKEVALRGGSFKVAVQLCRFGLGRMSLHSRFNCSIMR